MMPYSPEYQAICPERNTGPGPKPYPGILCPGGLAKFCMLEVGHVLFGSNAGSFTGRARRAAWLSPEPLGGAVRVARFVVARGELPQPARFMARMARTLPANQRCFKLCLVPPAAWGRVSAYVAA